MFTDFRERGRERNIDVREKLTDWLPCAPHWESNPKPGMCPDQEWNPQTFGVQDNIPAKTPGQGRQGLFKHDPKAQNY